MPLYEHVFLARQDVSGQQVEALVEQFKSVIEQNGGSDGDCDRREEEQAAACPHHIEKPLHRFPPTLAVQAT